MAEYDQITASTRRFIRSTPALVDMVFQKDPLLAYLRQNLQQAFPGGRNIEEPFTYDGMGGGPYAKGGTFDINEKQVEQSLQFSIKHSYVSIALLKEDIQIFNAGPAQAFSLVKSRTENAYRTMGANLALAMYLNGSAANYTRNLVGLPEMINDNSTASWDAGTYSTYGTITRGGAVGSVLNSVPVNVNGAITYPTLEEKYGDASYGGAEDEPNVLVTTRIGFSLIKETFQPAQRFNNINAPVVGFKGLEFNNAVILTSRYCPGSYLFGSSGAADPIAVSFIEEMSDGNLTAYPVPSGYTSGYWETLWMLNARKPYLNLYMTTDPEFGLGFTGFKPSANSTKIVGQVLFAGALTGSPRNHKQLYKITS